jgi:poly-gamma-glutamate synthesis protein (capsule biosynthesis protein)
LLALFLFLLGGVGEGRAWAQNRYSTQDLLLDDNDVVVYEIPPAPPQQPPPEAPYPPPAPPEEAPAPLAPAERLLPAKVYFLGDVMVHDGELAAAKVETEGGEDEWDFRPMFAEIAPYLKGGMAVANLETVLAGPELPYAGYPLFNSPDSLADALKGLGVHILALANNHIYDKREAGAIRTMEVLTEKGLINLGLRPVAETPNAPLLIDYDGLKWAFLNYTYGPSIPLSPKKTTGVSLNLLTRENLLEGLANAQEQNPDVVAVLVHWGLEYKHAPSREQIKIAELAAENGADLLIGTHPHVLQPITLLPSSKGHCLVAYSLGNFISNQRTLPRERSVILSVEMEKLPEGGARLAKVKIAPLYVSVACPEDRCSFRVLYGGSLADAEESPGETVAETGGDTGAELSPAPQGAPGATGAPSASPAGERRESADGEIVEFALRVDFASPDSVPAGAPGAAEDASGALPETGVSAASEPASEPREASVDPAERKKAAAAGALVLDFLGAGTEPDEAGFFTLWDSQDPEALPEPRRKVPR